MSVYIKSKCQCGSVKLHAKKSKTPPDCPKCGSPKSWDQKWYCKWYDEEGSPHTKSFTTRDMADVFDSEKKISKARGESVIPRDTTYLGAVSRFLDWAEGRVKKGKMKESTYKCYSYRLDKHLNPYFINCDIRSIDHDMADRYVAKRESDTFGRANKNYSPAEINRELATIKKLLSVSVAKKIIKESPLKDYELLEENNSRDWVLTGEEIEALLKECRVKLGSNGKPANGSPPDYLETMVILALNTGLRRDGVLGLCWEHIDNGILERVVKGDKLVRIPLNDDAKAALALWEKTRYRGVVPLRKTGLVFPSPKTGGRIGGTANIGFTKACERAGLKGFHFHDLRHCAATYMIAHCRDIHLVAKILGHSTTHMTERYAHIVEERAKDMMSGFSIKGGLGVGL